MSVLGPGENDAGNGDIDYCLGSIYLLNTFLRNSEGVDIVVVISALHIRKLVLKESDSPQCQAGDMA